MTAEWVADRDVAFGVFGDEPEPIVTALRDAGATVAAVVESDPAVAATTLDGLDVAVGVEESGLLAAIRADVDASLLPVGVGSGVEDVSVEDLPTVVSDIEEGSVRSVERPLLAASVRGERWLALMDAMAVTTEPAKISEFEIATRLRGEERTVDVVRADGVVVATSAGTPGYATAAGGPVLAPDARSVAVVPVGPFRVKHSEWVLRPPLSITVARDEAAVSLLVDDESVGAVPAHESVTLDWGPTVTTLTTDATRTGFDRSRR